MDPRGSSFLVTAVLIAVFAAVLLAGCTGTPSGGSNQTTAPTTQAINASVAGAGGAAPGAIAPPAETSLPAASGSPAQKAPETAATASVATTGSGAATETTLGAAGTIGTVGTLGAAGTIGTVGTLGAAGTIGTVGTLGAAETIGTVGTLGTLGTGGTVGTVPATATQDPFNCTTDFTATPTSGPAPLTVTFTASNTCSNIWTHEWTFGDGSENLVVDGATNTVTHTYTQMGTYSVHLTDDDHYLESGAHKADYITVTGTGDPMNCTADFTATPTTGPAPLTVTFTASNTCSPIWQHMWTFGDGSETLTVEGTVNTVTHTYTQPGTYSVHLTDDDHYLESGAHKADYITVTGTAQVSPTPTKCTTDFTASKTIGPAPLTVTFTATAPCDAQKRTWFFGDGGPMSNIEGGKVETYTYTEPGTYTVRLTEKFYGTGSEDFYSAMEEKGGYIHVTKGLVANPSLHMTSMPTLKFTPKITLVKPGITLEREKVVVIDPVGPVSGIDSLQR